MSVYAQPCFWSEAAAHARLEEIVWPNGPVCPHCGSAERIGQVTGKGARAGLRFCSIAASSSAPRWERCSKAATCR